MKPYRNSYPTHYIEMEIEDFYTYKYKDKMVIDPRHCPSVELNLIWNEKLYMIQKACALNPFQSEWFVWIDAGVCTYRDSYPPQNVFPNVNKLHKLPVDKFIYSSSFPYDKMKVTNTKYYHHISGTTYILHKNMIDKFVAMYSDYLERLVDKNNIWTDQVVLTHIYKDSPGIFYKLCKGYGAIVKHLM